MTSILDNVPFVGTQRNELRNLVRNHPDFAKWRAINDPTNAMRRPQIIKAISDLGLEAEAAKIISAPQVVLADCDSEGDTTKRESEDNDERERNGPGRRAGRN